MGMDIKTESNEGNNEVSKLKMKKSDLLSLALFLTLICIIVMDTALILPNQVLIAVDFNINFALLGLMIGCYIFIAGLSTIVFGYLTDKLQRKTLLIFAGLLWSITAMLHMLITEFWQLFTLRMIAAVATGVTTPVAFSYLADVVPSDSRSKAFAWWGLISTLGGLIAGILALSFNTIPYDEVPNDSVSSAMRFIKKNYSHMVHTWRIPFLILGIIALIFTVLNIIFMKEVKRGASEKVFEGLSDEDLHYSYQIHKSDLKFIFSRKSNFFLIMNFFDVVATGILMAYLFPYINIEMGIDLKSSKGILKIIVLLLIAAPMGFIVGQFGLAHWADKKVQSGDITGRIKVATICGILNLPFLIVAFCMSPNVRNSTFFFGTMHVNEMGFWAGWIIFACLLGTGLAFSFGIAPNWYSSLIDINYPEHRGTMIAMASFLDAIGRAFGAIMGGILIVMTDSITWTIFWATLIFGILSTCFWIPLFYTCEKDFEEVQRVMKERAEEMKLAASQRTKS